MLHLVDSEFLWEDDMPGPEVPDLMDLPYAQSLSLWVRFLPQYEPSLDLV